MREKIFVCALCVVFASPLFGTGKAGRTGTPSEVRLIEYADLAKYGCGYVVTYDDRKVKYIAVKTVLVYKDGHESVDYIPQVFHTNAKAKEACGQFEDEVEKILSLGK